MSTLNDPVLCIRCRYPLPEHSDYCSRCGAPQHPQPPYAGAPSPPGVALTVASATARGAATGCFATLGALGGVTLGCLGAFIAALFLFAWSCNSVIHEINDAARRENQKAPAAARTDRARPIEAQRPGSR